VGVKGQVRFADVRKVYRWRGGRARADTVKGALFHRRLIRGASSVAQHVALDEINLEVAPGEGIAVIGPNGSGKSTLLKLAGGILRPTSGSVSAEGRVTALIELGAGFHPEITGRENVVINGMPLGLSRAEIEGRMSTIVDFADIGSFIDQPVKTYSSGMYVRLGFAVAVAVEPDIVLIAEVLAVGDEAFTRRCLDRLTRMRQRGVTMVLVTHDLDLAREFVDRAVYLRSGKVVADGPSDTVVARYQSDVAGGAAAADHAARGVQILEEGKRWGTGDVEIVDVYLTSGGTRQRMVSTGTECTLHIRYKVHRPVEDFVFGIAWHRADGATVGGHNTDLDGLRARRLAVDGEVRCAYPSLQLAPGEYLLDVAIHARDGLAYDYRCEVARFRVTSAVDWPGLWAPPHRWEWDGPEME
jgi:ABC-type polysaccharide/polyol phosphate transport system ATPase subunit